MVAPRCYTCDDLLAMTTGNNRCIVLYELSIENLYRTNFRINVGNGIGWELPDSSKDHMENIQHVGNSVASYCATIGTYNRKSITCNVCRGLYG